MDNERVNILHISDLHYSKNSDHDQRVIYDALFKDVRDLVIKGMKPDLIVFSGDIVANGDDYESFSLVLDKIIELLLRDTELDERRILLVPGNHDVQRSIICKEDITQEGLEARLTDRDKLNQFYLNNTNYEYIRQKLNHFIELKECLSNSALITSDLFFDAYYMRELDIALACLNTAWMSRGGLSGSNDRQRLLVPEVSVRSALDAFPDRRTKILVGHHPLDWRLLVFL
jgi:predicted MPP superfamily phosphohydrolase